MGDFVGSTGMKWFGMQEKDSPRTPNQAPTANATRRLDSGFSSWEAQVNAESRNVMTRALHLSVHVKCGREAMACFGLPEAYSNSALGECFDAEGTCHYDSIRHALHLLHRCRCQFRATTP